MTDTPNIADFASAVTATRAEIGTIDARIVEVEHAIRAIDRAPPHTDEIIAALKRGLRDSAAGYERQLQANLTDTFVVRDDAAEAAGRSFQVLTIEATPPTTQALADRGMRREAPTINLGALAFFLADRIEAEIPELVERLCPRSKSGMRHEDRVTKRAAFAAELADLKRRLAALQGELGTARAAVYGGN